MTGKERMQAAILGQPVDRVPIWLREGFDLLDRKTPNPDDFTDGWQADPDYIEFCDFARDVVDLRVGWSPGGHFNRTLGIPPHYIRGTTELVGSNTRRHIRTIDTPKGKLTAVSETHRGTRTTWGVKYPVESLEDLDKLRSVPFEVMPVSYDSYERAHARTGDRGVLCLGVSSPWVVFSACVPFELALEWSLTEQDLVLEVLEEITQRCLACLEAVLSRPLDTIANIGGSEQCTPPMMSPEVYARFVTPFDGRIVSMLNEHGIPVSCHCHGHVSKALTEMVRMGFAATDPVEPPFGGGDVTMAQAREIVGDKLTLCGNLQFNELEHSTPEQVRARVREILGTGKQRLVLASSAGPITRVSRPMLANYRAWVEEALECGQC